MDNNPVNVVCNGHRVLILKLGLHVEYVTFLDGSIPCVPV